MTHRTVHLWVSLVVGVVVWGAYFAHFLQVVGDGFVGPMMVWFLGALIVAVLAEFVATGAITWLFRRRARVLDDGPTLDAALKASHVALMTMIALILAVAAALVLAAGFGWQPELPAEPRFDRLAIIGANVLLAIVVITELLRAALTLALLPKR